MGRTQRRIQAIQRSEIPVSGMHFNDFSDEDAVVEAMINTLWRAGVVSTENLLEQGHMTPVVYDVNKMEVDHWVL